MAPDFGNKIGLNLNCTDLKRLVTVPAWLTYVNHRYNPRKYGRAYGNYWPQPKGTVVGLPSKRMGSDIKNYRGKGEA